MVIRHIGMYADQGPYRRDLEMPFFKELIRAIHETGVIVTIGTDTSPDLEGSVPSNIHREMQLLVESGFSAFDALAAGTRNAGTIVNRMGRDGSFGTIAIGQRADLLLISGNPLDDVSHTRERIGLMVRGRCYRQNDLDRMVDELIATY